MFLYTMYPIRSTVKISGSGADPFAALVISTPVSDFILNSKTTGSYLFILLKSSIGTHLELLKFSKV